MESLKKNCGNYINRENLSITCSSLFKCGAGQNHFSVSSNGFYRPCMSLWHQECIYDLKKGSLREAAKEMTTKLRIMHSEKKEFTENCMKCPFINLCMWCPAHAHLEYGELDKKVEYFCKVARKRAENLKKNFRVEKIRG
jgi:radical SAM protein with 4Fe4S-binding SPASM domain